MSASVSGLKKDGVVHAVQEFGAEVAAEFGHHLEADAFLDFAGLARVLNQQRAAEVRGHDDDRIAEIHRAALAVGEAAVVEDLQEDVEDVVVRLLDLVEEHHAIGPAANRFGELAAFLVAHVAGRRADEPGHGVFLHVFAHVEAQEVFFAVEERFGERAGEFGFADARGTEKNERADGTLGVFEAGTGADHGVGDNLHGFLLADDALVENLAEAQEFILLAFEHFGDGNAGPGSHNLGDVFLGHFFIEQAFSLGPFLQNLLGGKPVFSAVRASGHIEFGRPG